MVTTPAIPVSRRNSLRGAARRILFRRLWLPPALYEALPLVYLLLGAGALASGLFLPDPGWVFGYLVLLGVGCLHVGVMLAALRRRRRKHALQRERTRRSDPAIVR